MKKLITKTLIACVVAVCALGLPVGTNVVEAATCCVVEVQPHGGGGGTEDRFQ